MYRPEIAIEFKRQEELGKKKRAVRGMTLAEVVALTDLPEDEAARRLAQAEASDWNSYYVALNLTEGIGEVYRKRQNQPKDETQKMGQVVQLPLWGEATRGTPNSFLRGALFAAIQGKEREYLKGQMLTAREGIKIRFTGMQLDQSDLDVWEQAVQLAAQHTLGNFCLFKIKAFLKELGRQTGKSDREWLKDSLRRLTATCVEITHGRYTYGGSMLEFWHDEESDIYKLQLNPKILSLYKAGWTAIDWEVRQKLRRKPLALWLHGYLSSDAKNYNTKLETLHRLSGSNTKELRFFKVNLKNALADLEKATDGRIGGVIKSDFVEWKRQPTDSQMRHLIKKASRKRLAKPPAKG